MTSPHASQPEVPPAIAASATRRRRRYEKFIVSGVLFVLAVALAVLGRDVFLGEQGAGSREQRTEIQGRGARSEEKEAAVEGSALPTVEQPSPTRDEDSPVEDDGQTLWSSPTDGPPLDLTYLPPGAQIILAVRPTALAANAEGEKILTALGPIGSRAIELVEQRTGTPFDQIERLLVGWRTTLNGQWDATLVVTPASDRAAEDLKKLLAGATGGERQGRSFRITNDLGYYQPEGRDDNLVVIASPTSIEEVIDLDGHAPPLRREMEQLAEYTDATRHVTILCAPNFLFSDGRGMFSGTMSRLRQPLFWFLGDRAQAAALSLDWHNGFFTELLAVPTLDTPPDQLANRLAQRVDELPNHVEEYVFTLSPQPYGRRIVARFPEMLRRLAAYTRYGIEDDCAVLRCYLPTVAGHNLLMGAELTLAEVPKEVGRADNLTGTPPVRHGESATEVGSPNAVRERLRRRTSLRFSRDTLETALKLLGDEVGVPIVIRGGDLRTEGITKNQSFGIDVTDRPADEILVEILRLANPDKSATGPVDPRQKLVYVIAPAGPGDSEAVVITTRTLATATGGELPAVFVEGPR